MRTHGTISSYRAGCRCGQCREVSAERGRRYRQHGPDGDHGRCLFCDGWFVSVLHHEPMCPQRALLEKVLGR